MNRTYTPRLLFAVAAFVSIAPSLAIAQLGVFVDDDNHFVMQSDGFDLLGIQLESASGSLVPTELSNSGPFDISLMKNSMVVMFGSLGRTVRVEGEVKLPTQWNPEGQQDVGFRWGSPTDEGIGTVVGHVAQFVTPRPSGVGETPEPAEEVSSEEASGDVDSDTTGFMASEFEEVDVDEDTSTQGGDVASDVPEIVATEEGPEAVAADGNSSSVPASILPGYVGLDLAAEPLLVYLVWSPEFDTLTVSSANALLAPSTTATAGVNVVSQSASSATFAFDDLPDGGYELPLSWLGNNPSDISLSISPADELVLLEVIGDAPLSLAPEPTAATTSLLALCLALPFFRNRYR